MQTKMTCYYKCNMKPYQHITAYILISILVSVIIYLFYHLVILSAILGFTAGFYLEKMYADSTIKKRQKQLRLQFKDFMEAMSVAVRAGNVEYQAVKSAYKDLQVSYNNKSDIIAEVENILLQYEKGGKELKTLFRDFAERSDLEDIKSFATIYSVIEGKSDRFGDILTQTQEIIGDKIEIEQEIQTTIYSAQTETKTMLIMPIVIVLALSAMGGSLLDSLFTTMSGHFAATIAIILFAISYVIANKSTDIEV